MALPLVAAIAALVILGCGGNEDESRSVSVSSFPREAFIKRADAICAQGRLQALRYQPSLPPARTGKALAESIDASVLPAIQGVVDKLYALGAPKSEKSRVEAFLEAFQQGVDEGEDLKVPSFFRLGRVLEDPGKLARKLGLESCVYG